jgi:Rrf2 family protein
VSPVRLQVSAKADYALRALVVLGAQPADRPVKTADIAHGEAMPLKFLENILVDLRRKGLVTSLRGPSGGFRLSRPADCITIADVLQAVDGPLSEVRGHQPGSAGYAEPPTALQRIWVAAEASVRSVFESVTLADLLRDELPDSIGDLDAPVGPGTGIAV